MKLNFIFFNNTFSILNNTFEIIINLKLKLKVVTSKWRLRTAPKIRSQPAPCPGAAPLPKQLQERTNFVTEKKLYRLLYFTTQFLP
jgi:hypothetical protein